MRRVHPDDLEDGARVQDLKLSVADILGRPGSYRDFRLHPRLSGVQTSLVRLNDDAIDAALRVESVVEGVLVTGDLDAGTLSQCARCLKELEENIEVEVCELYYAPGSDQAEDDSYRVSGTEIDLEPMVRDALALAMPLAPLCKEDCKGLCARCGQDLNVKICACTEETKDPRWAELDALRDQLAER
jgi:uncharacterized protein